MVVDRGLDHAFLFGIAHIEEEYGELSETNCSAP